jgi:FkbM family methyltransferase
MQDLVYYSQSQQDSWILTQNNFKKNGIFIDVGAYDGIQTSNTYTLETYFNWNGICIEANQDAYFKLNQNRKSINVYGAVTNYDGNISFHGDKIVTNGVSTPCFKLNSILEQNFDDKIEIDYLSLDVEGHEYTILESLDFNKWKIKYLTVEHNLYMNGPDNKNKIFELLISKGYTRVVDNAVCLDPNPNWYNKPYEDWYKLI